MVYRKSYSRRRPQRRYRRRSPGYFGQAGVDARKAVRMAGKALSLLNTEFKYSDVYDTLNPYEANAGISLLTGVAQGDTAATRDGNSAKLMSLDLNVLVQPNATTPSVGTVRLCLVQDNNSTSTGLSSGDSLYASAAGTAIDILAQRNIVNTTRYKVLKEKIITMDPSNSNRDKYVAWNVKFQNHHIKFSSTTAASQTDGKLYLVALGNNTALSQAPQVSFSSRIRFVDN